MASRGYQPKHANENDAPGARIPKVNADAPGKPGTKGPTKNRRRGPQHQAPTTAGPKKKVTGAARTAQIRRKTEQVADAARDYAYRQAVKRTEGRPSVTGRAVAGAAAGTAAGAALGGPVGAAAGAVLGGTGGAIAGAKAKKAYRLAMHASLGARRIIVMEFLICMVIAALSPLTDRKNQEGPGSWMRRMTAIMALFLILGLMSAAGRGSARFAAGFGGLVTAALVISNRDLFMKVTTLFSGASSKAVGTAMKEPVEATKGVGTATKAARENVNVPHTVQGVFE